MHALSFVGSGRLAAALAFGLATGSLAWGAEETAASKPAPVPPAIEFICTAFENGSPLQWEIAPDGTVQIRLLYDYERNSPNRAAGHWHFQLQGKPQSEVILILEGFENIYNGRPGCPVSKKSICYISEDGKAWRVIPTEFLEGNRLRIRVRLETGRLYLARLEPYRLSDLERLLADLRGRPEVEITPIGQTVEGRPLEIIRVGDPATPGALFRARAHAWEPGGNWVLEGLLRWLASDDPAARRCRKRYAVYAMPLANKDGVARGMTRFNVLGRDLNRNWDRPADPTLAPENHALETWLEQMRGRNRLPRLAIDFHNDESGMLHLSRPPIPQLDPYLARMHRLETLLRKHTWFTEGTTGEKFRNPGTFGEGLLERYHIDACILELNCNWIAGLQQHPSAKAWMDFGRQLGAVLEEYFAPETSPGEEKPGQ